MNRVIAHAVRGAKTRITCGARSNTVHGAKVKVSERCFNILGRGSQGYWLRVALYNFGLFLCERFCVKLKFITLARGIL
jgi:hypothetical protein